MDLLQTSAGQTWEQPPSADEQHDEHIEEHLEERPRKKRRKYIARACNECKRRKIKCNGQAPCHRCGRQQIECVYVENPRRDSLSENEYEITHDLLIHGRKSTN
ncbi:hypothetical protein PENSUB_1966 [Penicillium subrubescens]|uniref:Zn(2)-C6 fungal-type domain-containing protein n=1 Tax=Penicillium subrubescens TaxID=1316194 RepID=A0A1Q5UIC1_9EURO|nr:hypothetical protein PENSUB_1966 [Penicillium subrubescens]